MTVSRWETGVLEPSAEHYIQLGKLAGKSGCWFFWERAGLALPDLVRVLPKQRVVSVGLALVQNANEDIAKIPIRQGVVATHGSKGERVLSIDRIPITKFVGVPASWCPNPEWTSMLRVRGSSMEPLLYDGSIVAVDSLQTNGDTLNGKLVAVADDENGLWITRFRHYLGKEVLEAECRGYPPVEYGLNPNLRIVARVLWSVLAFV